MYNYTITRLSCRDCFRLAFCVATVIGGCGGLLLGSMERDAVGILGGAFLGLLCGLAAGLCGTVCAAILNLLAPLTGGIAVQLEPVAEKAKTDAVLPATAVQEADAGQGTQASEIKEHASET